MTHKHTWINQWDRRVCGECGFVEYNELHIKTPAELDQEGANDEQSEEAVGKRVRVKGSGKGGVAGANVEETAVVGSVEGVS